MSMNNLTVFENNAFGSVRVIEREGQPWFVAKDVSDCLEIGNTTEALRGLDDDEKFTLSNPEGNPRAVVPPKLFPIKPRHKAVWSSRPGLSRSWPGYSIGSRQ